MADGRQQTTKSRDYRFINRGQRDGPVVVSYGQDETVGSNFVVHVLRSLLSTILQYCIHVKRNQGYCFRFLVLVAALESGPNPRSHTVAVQAVYVFDHAVCSEFSLMFEVQELAHSDVLKAIVSAAEADCATAARCLVQCLLTDARRCLPHARVRAEYHAVRVQLCP